MIQKDELKNKSKRSKRSEIESKFKILIKESKESHTQNRQTSEFK